MKRRDLARYRNEELIEDYIEISEEQEQALHSFDTRRYNRLYPEMRAIEEELKGRPGDQRRMLMVLYRHENPKVRLNAARATLAQAPQAARAVIEDIAQARLGPLSGDAGMSLWALDEGISKPT